MRSSLLLRTAEEEVSESRRESEDCVSKVLEQATLALRKEFAKEMRLLDESRMEFLNVIEKDLPVLNGKLAQLKVEREAMEYRVARKRDEQISELKMEIIEEKTLREELEEAILRMLSDIAERLQKELESEKQERDSTEESLVSVLEDTCNKLQIN